MKNATVTCVGCLGLVCCFAVQLSESGESKDSQSSALVDAVWLQQQLAQPNLRVLEIGERDAYELGHLPRAQFVDWIVDITDARVPDRYNILPRPQFESLMSRLGIGRDTMVVLYDRFESRLSTRMFWTMRYYGHRPIKILDGGAKAWADAGFSYVAQEPSIPSTDYHVEQVNDLLEAKRKFIYDRLGRDRIILVDGRPPAQYTGEEPGKVYHTGKAHDRRGHLPRALSVPWQENLTTDGKFKSVSELRKIYTPRVPSKSATVVTYCNEGLHAAHPWFVLTELLGCEDVRLYDDSLSEWANTSDAPLVVSRKADANKQ